MRRFFSFFVLCIFAETTQKHWPTSCPSVNIRKWQILALPPVFDSFVITPRSNQWLIKRDTKCQLIFFFSPRCSPFLHSGGIRRKGGGPFLFWTFASSVGHERSPFAVRLFFFPSQLGEREREKIDALFRKSCDKQFSWLMKSDNDRKNRNAESGRRACAYSFWLIWHTNYSSSICSDTIVNSLEPYRRKLL